MSKNVWLIIASILVILGISVFVVTMSILKWDFLKLSTADYQTKTYEMTEDFGNITIDTDTADITFIASTNQTASVVCYEEVNTYHTVEIKNDTLNIKINNAKKWYEYIGIMNFQSPTITVYLPKTEYKALFIDGSTADVFIPQEFKFDSMQISLSTGDTVSNASVTNNVKISADTGDIKIQNATVGSLDLSVSTGTISVYQVTSLGDVTLNVSSGKSYLTNFACKSLTSRGNTGDITLINVVVGEKLYIERSTGDVEFEALEANEICILTSTGDVEGSLLSDKTFIVSTSTGEINIPQGLSGGKCEISTSTGDIEIFIKK